jgi:hypothetical protein
MARYFFHVKDMDGVVSRDGEGQELPSLNAARAEAVNSNREMLGEHILHGGAIGLRQIEIADDKGEVLATITVTDVLMDHGQPRAFADDVTKSAPHAEISSAGKKTAAE